MLPTRGLSAANIAVVYCVSGCNSGCWLHLTAVLMMLNRRSRLSVSVHVGFGGCNLPSSPQQTAPVSASTCLVICCYFCHAQSTRLYGPAYIPRWPSPRCGHACPMFSAATPACACSDCSALGPPLVCSRSPLYLHTHHNGRQAPLFPIGLQRCIHGSAWHELTQHSGRVGLSTGVGGKQTLGFSVG